MSKFPISRHEVQPDLTTLEGLKKETYTAVVRYFAPAVAIARELGITAAMPITWWTNKDLEDRRADEGKNELRHRSP
jgi:hypothetical protein